MPDNSRFTRRELLKAVGAIGAGSILSAAGAMAQTTASAPASGPAAGGDQKVPRRKFGRTGVEVSILSLGGMFDIPSNQLMLKKACQWGITHWDMAYEYGGGNSERGVGMFFERNPALRKEIFLVTKSARQGLGLDDSLKASLERMKTDYVDLFQFYSVENPDEIDSKAAEWKAWAERAKKAGKIKFVGLSTHKNMDACLQAAAKAGFLDAVMMSYNFRIMNTDAMKSAVEACAKAGIAMTAMKTQAGKSAGGGEGELKLLDRFVRKGFTGKQAALKAVWENPAISNVCSQMPNLTILNSNYLAAIDKTQLSADDRRALDEYAAASCSGYCAGCASICETAAGGGLPVADVMRYMMYHNEYGLTGYARGLFAKLPDQVRHRLATADFSAASARCPQRIEITRMMKLAGEILA